MTHHYSFLLIFVFVFSCQNQNDLDWALSMAKENRAELEKVLTHYRNDSLKLQAAGFLITNMVYWYSYTSERIEEQMEQYELKSTTSLTPQEITDSINRKYGPFDHANMVREYDIYKIDSAFLVRHIDFAFKVWEEQPWGKNVTFENFCEYVLPYRIGDEKLCDWREDIYNRYNHFFIDHRDSLSLQDPLFAARLVMDSLSNKPIHFTTMLPYTPHVGPRIVDWRSGTCRELSDMVVYTLRSLGIPCGIDFMIRTGNNNVTHYWNFVLDKNGHTMIAEYADADIREQTQLHNNPKGKVHRNTFSLNKVMYQDMRKISDIIAPSFRYPKFLDVTSIYSGKYNLKLKFPGTVLYDSSLKNEIVYLCLSERENWVPVGWSAYKKDSVLFEDVEGNVVFRLATYNGKNLVMQSDPFSVEKNTGVIRFFDPQDEMETVKLLFKHHLYVDEFIFRMPGGVFEASNHANFADADTLHIIKDVPNRLCTTVYTHNTKKYRYVRYKGPEGSYCNISELLLYENAIDTIPFYGDVIGTPGCLEGDGSHEFTNVFDGDPYTSFNYLLPDSGWAGMDFKSPRKIEKLVYIPRNRDNFIRKGDLYELLYWKNRQWNSAGRMIAQADSLLYSVPKNSLLYLKNHTRGKDERIFEYTNDEQKFW